MATVSEPLSVPSLKNPSTKEAGGSDASFRAKKSKSKNIITPGKNGDTSFDSKMVVEREIVDELLLVCGVIGTTTGEGDELVPVTDCLNWLQDLQRALRRDDDIFRPISLLIGKWKVVEQKLLPLVLTCRYDTAIVLTVVKILVILTKPLAESTKSAGRMIIDTSSKVDPSVISHQIKLRDNALEQAQLLLDYKRIVAHHSSHHSSKHRTGLLSVFVSLLAEPLSRSGASRTDADHLTIELVFHLFRNLMAAEPLLNTSSDASRQSNQLHQELIALFDKELVLEIFLVLGQDMEARENAQYNLLMMELLHHLLKTQDPAAVARAQIPQNYTSKKSATLAAKLKQEQLHRRSIAGARHAHFGGTWMKQQRDGKTSFVGAARHHTSMQASTSATRKNRKAEPFIGSGKALLSYCRKECTEDGPSTQRANESLNKFCERFIKDCYGPVMKSLKNEFRRDSHRLQVGDKVVFFRIIWFFCQWWRFSKNTSNLGQLIFTMDVFTFNLVLTSTDSFHQHKQYSRLAQAVALYSEMMHLLLEMHVSKDETESVMARGLLDRLFYGAEPIDRLPRLLTRWSPGLFTREYLCDLVELCHICLKLLDMNQRECCAIGERAIEERNDKVEKMRATAAQFDVKGYFCRKIVSNHLISMYTHLLGQYKVNSPSVNHRVLAMLLRISRTKLVVPEVQEVGVPINPLGSRLVTLEPMLFNIHLVVTAGKILGDASITNDQTDFKELITFCTNLFNHFLSASQQNPMIFVECLFRHPAPHRFCELFSNLYVSEELRMIAEREILLDEQRQHEEDPPSVSGESSEQDDEAENEFDDAMDQATKESSHEISKVGPDVSHILENESQSDDFHDGNSQKDTVDAVDADDSSEQDDEAENEFDDAMDQGTEESSHEISKVGPGVSHILENESQSDGFHDGNSQKNTVDAVDADDSSEQDDEAENEFDDAMDQATEESSHEISKVGAGVSHILENESQSDGFHDGNSQKDTVDAVDADDSSEQDDEAENEFDDAMDQATEESSHEISKVGPGVSHILENESQSDGFHDGNSQKRTVDAVVADDQAEPGKRLKTVNDS